MYSILFLVIGVVIGILGTVLFYQKKTGQGYFKLEKIPDEEDLYTLNFRVPPDQQLDKKTRIILTRE